MEIPRWQSSWTNFWVFLYSSSESVRVIHVAPLPAPASGVNYSNTNFVIPFFYCTLDSKKKINILTTTKKHSISRWIFDNCSLSWNNPKMKGSFWSIWKTSEKILTASKKNQRGYPFGLAKTVVLPWNSKQTFAFKQFEKSLTVPKNYQSGSLCMFSWGCSMFFVMVGHFLLNVRVTMKVCKDLQGTQKWSKCYCFVVLKLETFQKFSYVPLRCLFVASVASGPNYIIWSRILRTHLEKWVGFLYKI